MCLLSLCHLGLLSLYAIMAKGWHSPTGSRMQQVRSSLDVLIHGHGEPESPRVLRTAERDLEHHASRKTCGFLSPLSTSASAHEVGHLHTYPKPHTQKQFTNFINISDLSLVTCFVPKSEEFLSEGIFSTVNLLLRTASWSHKY